VAMNKNGGKINVAIMKRKWREKWHFRQKRKKLDFRLQHQQHKKIQPKSETIQNFDTLASPTPISFSYPMVGMLVLVIAVTTPTKPYQAIHSTPI